MSVRILIAGGGTSGHINPAISIADGIRKKDPGAVVEFCGTATGLENDLVAAAGYRLHHVRAKGLPEKISWDGVKRGLEIVRGIRQAKILIRDFEPDVVVGTGGYVCAPLICAAAAKKIPILLHEPDALPGRANRWLSKGAVVSTGFPGAKENFPKAKEVFFAGNPVRDVFFEQDKKQARRELGIEEDTFFLLAMGGSLGSATINRSIIELGEMEFPQKIKVVLSAGKQQGKTVGDVSEMIEVKEYIMNPALYMAAANLLVARTGAITCAEIAAVGAAAIMIPYPYAAGDHQMKNAKCLEDAGAGLIMEDKDVTGQTLYDKILPFLSQKEMLKEMQKASKRLAAKGAAEKIADKLLKIAGKGVK